MTRTTMNRDYRALMTLVLVTIAAVGVDGGPADAQSRKQREDARTCAGFGTSFGTPAFSNCMLEQQRRRDDKERETLEKMAITSQLAKGRPDHGRTGSKAALRPRTPTVVNAVADDGRHGGPFPAGSVVSPHRGGGVDVPRLTTTVRPLTGQRDIKAGCRGEDSLAVIIAATLATRL